MLIGYGLFILALITTLAVLLILAIRHPPPVAHTLEEIREAEA